MMFGGFYDQQALGLGPHLTMVGDQGGGPGVAGSASPLSVAGSSDNSTLVAWGVLVALLVVGYLFFAPITL